MQKFTLATFLIWGFFEFTLICFGIYFLFGESHIPFWEEFSLIIFYTISIVTLPYSISCLIILVCKLSQKRQSPPESIISKPETYQIRDEKGKLMLSLLKEQILMNKSENNYITIYYTGHNQVQKSLVRTSLKKLNTGLQLPDLIRVHRSFMVNLQHIEKVERRRGNFEISIKNLPNITVKVSDMYKKAFESTYQNPA